MEEFQIQLKEYLILSKKLEYKLHSFISKYFISQKYLKKNLKKQKLQ